MSFLKMEHYVYYVQVKFHIISYHHLHRSSGTPKTSSMSHLNVEQLMKALTTLFSLYEVNRASHSVSQNESEFFSLYLLLHLGPDNKVMHSLLVAILLSFFFSLTCRLLLACEIFTVSCSPICRLNLYPCGFAAFLL